jgi:hypothetical protein
MYTAKIKEALADLVSQRNQIDLAISQLQAIIQSAEGVQAAFQPELSQADPSATHVAITPSYIDDAVTVLRHSGKPLHIRQIMERISELRGKSLHRNSVEASINRHVLKSKVNRKLSRFGPSIYGLSEWKESQPPLVQIA